MLFRTRFLTFAAVVALAVGTLAVALPHQLLASKGVTPPNDAAAIWVREVGVIIASNGMLIWLVRNHVDSPTLRAVLWGNAALQFGLFPIEI